MKKLIEDYERRLKTVMKEITKGGNDLTINRLGTKASCYRIFLTELNQALTISDVSGRVFHFVIHKPSGKIGYYNKFCNRFIEYNNYFSITPKTAINCDSFQLHYR